MKYFGTYSSNTLGASGNQLAFSTGGKKYTSRAFYKIFAGGEYNYSILFSNTADTTFNDGSLCHCGYVFDSWELHSARIGKCSFIPDKPLSELSMDQDIETEGFVSLTFDGKPGKTVMPGGFFASDPIRLHFEADEYLCLEITCSGEEIPYHKETDLPVYALGENGWEYTSCSPAVSMVGCDRPVRQRIAYLGDSITQGCGTTKNGYRHWNALLSKKLSPDSAYHNLGLGFARAGDAAQDGALMYRAKKNDVVFVMFGVNDILQGRDEEQIKKDLERTVGVLKKSGITVILHTVPPFDYRGENIGKWERINDFIKNELKNKADLIFDNSTVLSKSADEAYNSKYGGHPSDLGCEALADALYGFLREHYTDIL